MKQSRKLTIFYNAYHDWLMDGARETHGIFSRRVGLCGNLCNFYKNQNTDMLLSEMKTQFNNASLNKVFPFGKKQYLQHTEDEDMHLDPNRILWVRAHLTTNVNEKFTPIGEI